ncbi:hypothetical protein BGX38DRAFT_394274 [Terfezia claveryi]|nr:hypothetical protein BGX38DRAFT_394274 [Terfezia claveryi]
MLMMLRHPNIHKTWAICLMALTLSCRAARRHIEDIFLSITGHLRHTAVAETQATTLSAAKVNVVALHSKKGSLGESAELCGEGECAIIRKQLGGFAVSWRLRSIKHYRIQECGSVGTSRETDSTVHCLLT